MKKIILYGAGKRGNKIHKLLSDCGVEVYGFCETVPTNTNIICNGQHIAVYSYDEIVEKKEEYEVVITIADQNISAEVKEKCYKDEICIKSVEDFIPSEKDEVIKQREIVANYHVELMDDYFEDAEQGLDLWWNENSIFYQLFSTMNLTKVVELACGRGRHVGQYIDNAEEIILVDILDKNINYCKERFKGYDKVKYYVNNGHDLYDIEDDSCTAIFSYDSMVHFELMDIFSYLKEINRILKKGGKALLHHSNNHADYTITFLSGTHGRNYMSKDLFAYLAHRAGLKIVHQELLPWSGIEALDCITMLEK